MTIPEYEAEIAAKDAEIEALLADINLLVAQMNRPVKMPTFGETLEAIRVADEAKTQTIKSTNHDE